VTRIDDNQGKVIMKRDSAPSTRRVAVNPATAYQVHDMLRSTMKDGNLKGRVDDMPTAFQGAVKTGSTFDFSGCWSLGYSSRVACGVWCGFLQGGAPAMYEGAFGKDIALPVWKAAMQALPQKYLQGEIRRPSNIEEVDVCRVSGMRATPHCYESVAEQGQPAKLRDARRKELFRAGTEFIPSCPLHTAAITGGNAPIMDRGADLTVVDARPVHAREPLLLGSDPYQSEVPDKSIDAEDQNNNGVFFRAMENVFDNLSLGDEQAQIPLVSPGKLEIEIEID
jgi:penicillin-binding protein 1A